MRAKKGRPPTITLPLCETIDPLRLLTSPHLVMFTHFKIRLPENLLSLPQEIMSLTLKVHGLGL